MVKYQASNNFVHRQITGLDVLISVGGNIANFDGYVQLNATASAIWQFLSVPRSAAEVEGMLMERYQLPREEARADAAEFLELLRSHRMVTVTDDGL